MESAYRRNIILYYAANFLMGFYLANGTTVLFERELGLSFSQIFTLDAIYMLMFILFEIPTGAFADLMGRKRTVLIGLLTLAVGALVTGSVSTFLGLFLSFFIWAFGFSLISGSSEAMLYDTIQDEKKFRRVYGRASSLAIIGMAASGIVGPLLYEEFFRLPYLLSAVPFLLAAILLFFFREEKAIQKGFSVRNQLCQMREGAVLAFQNRFILWSMGALALIFAVSYTFTSSYQPYLTEVGFRVSDFIYILPFMFVIEALGGTWSDTIVRRLGETRTFWFNFLALGVSLTILGFFASKFVVPLLVLYGFLQGVVRPLLSTYANRYIDSEHRATIISVQGMFSTATASLLLFLFGFLTDKIGVIALAGVIGILVLIIGTALLLLKPKAA